MTVNLKPMALKALSTFQEVENTSVLSTHGGVDGRPDVFNPLLAPPPPLPQYVWGEPTLDGDVAEGHVGDGHPGLRGARPGVRRAAWG